MKSDIVQVRDNSSAPTGVDPSQWSSNPYANYDYKHSWWQKLIEGIGLRSKWDSYRENMALNSSEYQSQLLEKAHNEEYENPINQVARQRAAGLNPDLNGNVDSGSASPMEPDPNAPIASEPDDPMATISTFTNMVMSAFTGSIGLAQNIIGMLGSVEDVQGKAISNRNSVINDALSWAMRHVPDVYPENSQDFFHSGLLSDQAEDYALEYGYRPRDQRLFSRTVRDFLRSAPGSAEAYKAWYDRAQARTDWAGAYGSSLFSESDSTLRSILNPIIEATDKIRKIKPVVEGEQLDTAGAQAAYEGAYYNELNGELAGQVENTTNERNLHSSNIDSILNECMDNIISNLKDKSESGKRGHNFATAALLIFSLLRMTNFNPSVSRVTSQGSTPWGPTSSSRTSLGF